MKLNRCPLPARHRLGCPGSTWPQWSRPCYLALELGLLLGIGVLFWHLAPGWWQRPAVIIGVTAWALDRALIAFVGNGGQQR